MNPANFPNVGGGMPAGAPAHGQMPKVDNQVMMNYVAQALQAQGTYTGWRAEVPLKDRVVRVYQMFTSLRLIQPQADLQNLAQAALSFEQKAFKDAQQKVDYDKECNDKLLHIRDTRARQAAVIQNGMMPQGGPKAAAMRGVGQPPFPQQMSRAMQANPMAGQQAMAMGMNDPNQVAMQQQRPQQPPHQQQQQQQQAILQQQQQQRAQQRPGGGAALPDELHNLSAAEYEHVCRVASQIMAKTPQEDVEKIKSNLQNMNPEQRRYLNQKGMDPVAYFFRSQALAQLRRHKRNRMEAARAQNASVDPNNPMMGEMLNPQQRQMFQSMMGLQRNSAFPMGAQPGVDSSFLGNVENIQGQQADGLRSQEAGQLVVPASSSQINQNLFNGNQQNVFPVNQPMNQGGQANSMGAAGMNPQFFAQQHLQNASNVPQDRAQPTGTPFQPQAQSQNQAQARAQAAQKAQMAISQAGQANTHLQQQQPPLPQQQSPPLSMLNRPMAPGQMSPAQVAAQVRPPSRAPAMGQQPSMGGQQPMQGRPQIPQGLSPAVQEQLAQMTPEQINMFLHQRRAMANNPALARANANQQSMPMQQNISQPTQGQPMPNPQNMRTLNLQQQLAAGMAGGNAGHPPNPMMSAQQLSSAQHQQRQELYKLQFLRQQSGNLEMSMEQSKEMDRLHFPPTILSNNANMVSPVPKHIKTWGHLKQWASQHPQLLGGMDMQKLLMLQRYHFTQIMNQSKERNRSADQTAQGNWMPGPGPAQQPQQSQLPPQHQQQQQQQPGQQQQPQPQPMMNPQQLPAGQQPNPMKITIPPATAQDILNARQRMGGNGLQLSDDHIRELINRSRQKQFLHAAQNRAAQAQALAALQGQQTPAQQPAPVTAAAVGARGNVDASGQQQAPHHQPQPQSPAQPVPAAPATKAPVANKGAKGAANKQAGKRKLPAEEAAEAQNNSNTPNNNTTNNNQKATAAPPGGAVPGGPPRPNMPFTPKQLAAMPPQQRAQLEAHIRRQQGQTRTRAAAEEAWNNLPEKIRQAYHSTLEQAPPAKPIPVAPEQKAAMGQQLRDCTDMLGRMDTLVQWFAKIPNQEKNVRSLLAMRIQLMRQFKPTPDWTLNDDLTITPEYLTVTINYIKKLFHAMITRVSQHQNQVPGARPGGPQAVPAGIQQPPNQNNMPPLNASNLQQLQQQEEALQRARRASSQTAVSATSAVPPAPFGAPSPQGVPHAYGPGSMPPEQLKLPPMKKRKQSHAGATPTSATPGSKPAATKPADAKMPSAALAGGAYPCSVPECQHHLQGFPTQAALDKHVEESHKEDAIEDPLAFALDSFRNGLVKPGDQPDSIATTTTIKKDAQPVPIGATPAVSGTTPMGRLPSQQQQPPSQGLTPQLSTSKGPAPTPAAKAKDGKKDSGKPSEPTPSMETTLKDPWADSAISLESIHDAFVDLGDDGGLGFGAMDEFLNADMFTNTQDTPDSVESAPVTQTPKDGEVPRLDDTIGKAVDGPPEDHWIPADWINFPGPFEDEFLLNQPVIDIDWDAVERGDVDASAVALHAM